MLDKDSERVLQYLINKISKEQDRMLIPISVIDSDALNMSFSFFSSVCQFLQTENYVQNVMLYVTDPAGRLNLTHKGFSYFEYKSMNKKEYIKHLLLSKISDIIVSFVVALITALIVA